jgi:hypothetical protein
MSLMQAVTQLACTRDLLVAVIESQPAGLVGSRNRTGIAGTTSSYVILLVAKTLAAQRTGAAPYGPVPFLVCAQGAVAGATADDEFFSMDPRVDAEVRAFHGAEPVPPIASRPLLRRNAGQKLVVAPRYMGPQCA